MKNISLIFNGILLLVGLFWLGAPSQAQSYQWAKRLGGSGFSKGNSIAVDGSGNVYTTGNLDGTVTVVDNLTATEGFVSKHDASGNLIWLKSLGVEGTSLAVDGIGNVFITGRFYGTIEFDLGSEKRELTSSGVSLFVLKLNTAGNFAWAIQLGEAPSEKGRMIAVDGVGNAYTTSGGEGSVLLVNKLDGVSGGLVWARSLGLVHYEFGLSVAVDRSGNVFTAGSFRDVVDFDPGSGSVNLTSAGDVDVFVHKLDKDGNFVWVKQMGGPGEEDCQSVTVDGLGNVYTTGHFFSSDSGPADFDPGAGVAYLDATGTSSSLFVSKLDGSGKYVWAKRIGGEGYNYGLSIAVDGSNNVYTTGYFEETTDFDPGPRESILTSAGDRDAFICKLDGSGNFVWARHMGGSDDDQGLSIAVDGSGNVYTTGNFGGTADFNPDDGIANLTVEGRYNIFISKLEQVPIITGLNVTPNPSCVGSSISLTATIGNLTDSFTYTLTSSSSTTSGTSSNPLFSQQFLASESGNQSFTLTVSINGKSISASTSVVINSPPLVELTSNGLLTCSQSSVTLTASGGTSYHFSSPASQQGGSASPTATVSQPGLYSVTVTASNGCQAIASTNVTSETTLSSPTLEASAQMTTNLPLSISASGCSGGTINWLALGGAGSANGSIYTFSNPGSYSLSASCSLGSCTSSASEPLSLTIQSPFAIATVNLISCQPTENGRRLIKFTPVYSGRTGEKIVLAIAYDNFITDQPGPYTLQVPTDQTILTFIAQQGSSTAFYNFRWLDACQIGPTNQPPTTRSIASQTALTGKAYQLSLVNYFTDPEGQSLTFSSSALPAGLNLTGAILGGVPTVSGSFPLSVTATDPIGQHISTSFWLTITDPAQPNRAPTTTGITSQTAQQGQGYSLGVAPYFADPDGNPLIFVVSSLPANLNLTGGVISGTPSTTGSFPISVTAVDPGGLFVVTRFQLTVNGMIPTAQPFVLVGVNTLGCQHLGGNQRQVTFTPQYTGLTGEQIVLAMTNGYITTQAGPYTQTLSTDQPLLTLIAQQGGTTSVYNYNWLSACSNGARRAAGEPSLTLQVKVLGNPVQSQQVELEIRGVVGSWVEVSVLDAQGRSDHQQRLDWSTDRERVSVSLAAGMGVQLVKVQTQSQSQTLKVVKEQ